MRVEAMTCNNARAEKKGDRYTLTIPDEYQEEKNKVLAEAIEKYNGYVHIEISRVRKPKSIEANNLFHGVLTEYYKSGLHSVRTWQELKDTLKLRYGAGFLHTLEIDGEQYGILKSVAEYTSQELSELIDGTIKECLQVGLDSKKFREILEGIKYDGA